MLLPPLKLGITVTRRTAASPRTFQMAPAKYQSAMWILYSSKQWDSFLTLLLKTCVKKM